MQGQIVLWGNRVAIPTKLRDGYPPDRLMQGIVLVSVNILLSHHWVVLQVSLYTRGGM